MPPDNLQDDDSARGDPSRNEAPTRFSLFINSSTSHKKQFAVDILH
jgi:hypothetical protein